MFDLHAIIDCPRFETTLEKSALTFPRGRIEAIDAWLAGFAPSPVPHIVHTLGFVGSGKSTVKKQFLAENAHYMPLGFDAVMESFAEYRHDFDTLGAQAAFERWELPARALGYEILGAAIDRHLNIMFENSGTRADHVALLARLKGMGWRVTILDTLCDPRIALQRARARPEARWFPDSYVFERKAAIDALKPLYREIADEWLAFDTSGAIPKRAE